MDLSDDLPPPRRALFFPVVIATVFLSIIGMSVGLVLGSRQKAEDRRAERQVQQQQQQQQAAPTAGAVTRPSGPPCLPETQDQAELLGVAGRLTQVLRLRTRTSVVYICADEAGSMYYHANNGGETWIEGETALFLPNVVRDADGYRATAGDGATFSVNKKRLFIVHKDGREETQPAA